MLMKDAGARRNSFRTLASQLSVVLILTTAVSPTSVAAITRFDCYAGDRAVRVYWTWEPPHSAEEVGSPTETLDVQLAVSSEPDKGYRIVIAGTFAAVDSTTITGLTNGRTYFIRSQVPGSDPSSSGLTFLATPRPSSAPLLDTVANQADDTPRYFSAVSWAPDARRLAFVRADSLGASNVHIADVNTGAVRRLTGFPADEHWLRDIAWSPDGGNIAFCYSPSRTSAYVDSRVWTYRLESGTLTSVSPGRDDFAPCWTSSDELLFCGIAPGGMRPPLLYRVSPSPPTLPARIEQDTLLWKYSPSYFPGRRQVLFDGREVDSGRSIFYLMSEAGGPSEVILDDWQFAGIPGASWENLQPVWAPDGRGFFFSSSRSGHFEIWYLELSTRRSAQISQARGQGWQCFSSAPSPDGAYLAWIEEHFMQARLHIARLQNRPPTPSR